MAKKPSTTALVPYVFVMPVDASDEYKQGVTLAESDNGNEKQFGGLDTADKRKQHRAGFVAFRMSLGYDEKQANNRFDYLASLYSPEKSSRKAKSNKAKRAKGAGRKPKTDGAAVTISAAVASARLLAITNACAAAMTQYVGNAQALELAATIQALANPVEPEKKGGKKQ